LEALSFMDGRFRLFEYVQYVATRMEFGRYGRPQHTLCERKIEEPGLRPSQAEWK
jgi:hypothetical protein